MTLKSLKQRITSDLAIFAVAAACTVTPIPAYSQGKTTTETRTDVSRGVNVETTKDEKGNVIKEKESDLQGNPTKETDREFDKDGNCTKETEKDGKGNKTKETVTEYNKDKTPRKKTIRSYYPNGKLSSETIIIYDPDGTMHGTKRTWDKDGNPSGSGKGEREQTSTNDSSGGALRTVRFASQNGEIRVNLPADMAAGDTISGTVMVEPAGRTEAERAKNAAELRGLVLEAEDGPNHRVALGKVFQIALPVGASTLPLWFLHDGVPMKQMDVAVAPRATGFSPTMTSPAIIQSGRPFAVTGPFDGNASNTTVQMDGRELPILAESPRSLIVDSPAQVGGPQPLSVHDGSNSLDTTVQSVRLTMTAPKTNLLKGESTTVSVMVEGLEGLPSESYPMALEIENHSPSVVMMQNTKDTLIGKSIPYHSVSHDGSTTIQIPVQGISAGAYSMSASIVPLW